MSRRWVKVGLIAAVVLAAVGYFAKPYAEEWWLAREACGGAVPAEAVDELAPDDERLSSDYEYLSKEIGQYTCQLFYGDSRSRKGVTAVAYTNRDSQDLMMRRAVSRGTGLSVGGLPTGLPGFTSDNGALLLLRTCPDLGEDAEGRPRRMLVRTTASGAAPEKSPDALLRTAVALTNRSSDELGCGAEPLKAPAHVLPAEPKPVPLSAAANTPCAWLASAKLPKDAQWTLGVVGGDAAPLSRCELFRASGEESTGPGRRQPTLVLNAWHGDWSEVAFGEAARDRAHSEEDGWYTRPLLTAEWGRAKARCDGEAVNFEASSREAPGIKGPQLRALLTAFAKDQTERRGCTDLALPGRELPLPKR
ncbi:hypothetical protein AB0M39_29745 [Streptomyces sp. NPDC051907]|uniref:hypothetical protein n=1 Tax=Streptomyces sp. NPDC051907 TaxID=3155284 RepID=UPI00343BC19E